MATAALATANAARPAAASATGGARIGLDINAAETDLRTLRTRLNQMKAAGVQTVSSGAVWWYMCPTQRSCSYADLDRLVAEATARQLQVTLQISGVPDWVHPDLSGRGSSERWWALPRNDAERAHFERFVRTVATRYQGRVARYEIWNEPNLPEFSYPRPSPALYARTLASGYQGVKGGDPRAIVASGGLSRTDLGFARALLTELQRLPGAQENRLFFDEFGVHPYSDADSPLYSSTAKVHEGAYGPVDNNFDGVTRIAALLDERGQQDKKLWLGEYGFSTTRTWMSAVPDQRRALYLMMAIDKLRTWDRVSGLVWYSFLSNSATGSEWTIMSPNGSPSRTFAALAAKQANAPGTGRGSPCARGELSGTHTWGPECVPGSDSGYTGYEIYVNGALAASGSGRQARLDTRRLPDGMHRVTIAHVGASRVPVYTSDAALRINNTGGPGRDNDSGDNDHSGADAQGVSATTPTITRVGGAHEVRTVVTARRPMTVEALTVAVRDSAGRNHDFPGHHHRQVLDASGTTVTLRRTFAPGEYTAWVAYQLNGRWYDLSPEVRLAVR